jgi:hypothetical protein
MPRNCVRVDYSSAAADRRTLPPDAADRRPLPTNLVADPTGLAARRALVLAPLAEAPRCSRAAAQAAAAALGLSQRQVYTLVVRLRAASGDSAVLLPRKRTGGQGRSRLPPVTERILHSLIVQARRSGTKTPAAIARMVQCRCRERKLAVPSLSTIRRRLAAAALDAHSPPARSSQSSEDESAGLLTALCDTVGNSHGWSAFMEALARTYPGGRGLLAVHDVTLRGSRAQAGGGWDPDLFSAYNQHFVAVNPWIPSLNKRPIGRVVPAEFMLPRADLVRTEFYQDFLRRDKLDSGVGVTVQRNGARQSACCFRTRPRSATPT